MKAGFASKKFAVAALLTGLLGLSGQCCASDLSLPITGDLLGSVVDGSGIPQMGATVQLFNKYERLIAKTLSAPDGRFAFAGLPADVYSVRVSLANFLPAVRDKIAVKAGIDSILQIHLATLFSDVQVTFTIPTGGMSDDWKWVLRSSPATRPITRFLPDDVSSPSTAELHPHIFSGTHAMLSLSGGDTGLIDSDSVQTDLGTGFVLSTSLLGKNQLQVGGTFAQGNFGPGAMGLCAIYTRSDNGAFGQPPEVTLTIAQLGGIGPQLSGTQLPALRTMSLSVYEVADPLDSVHIEYGMTGESVDYLQHTSRVSPFARVTVSLGHSGEAIAAYSDGGRPDELSAHQQYQAAETDNRYDDLVGIVNTLARLPQLSERNGRLELQRTQSYELGYNNTIGSRTYAVSGFYEDVSNGRINVAGDLDSLDSEDLLSDGISKTSTYNIGHYNRSGYLASLNQRINDSLDVALAYGRMGGFTAGGIQENFLDERNHNLAAVNVAARVPTLHTKISANYGWFDSGALIPRHVFTTQNMYVSPGLNVIVRQPLPSLFGMPGRLELTADLRNLLAQGYLPLDTGDAGKLLIVQAPRAIRGGLNFIF